LGRYGGVYVKSIKADRIDANICYGFDAASGKLYLSGNGGIAFEEVHAATDAIGDGDHAQIRPHPQQTGAVWIAASRRGLLHWSSGGRLERVPGVDNVFGTEGRGIWYADPDDTEQ